MLHEFINYIVPNLTSANISAKTVENAFYGKINYEVTKKVTKILRSTCASYVTNLFFQLSISDTIGMLSISKS